MSTGWDALLGTLSLLPLLGGAGALIAAAFGRLVITARWSPGWKSAALLLCLAFPMLLVTTLVTASFLPSLLDYLGVVPDNCSPDHTHHPHLCPLHPSASITGPALWLCVVGALWAGATVVSAGRAMSRLLGSRLDPGVHIGHDELPHEQRTMLDATSDGLRVPVQVIRSPLPVAALVGFFRPRVLVSTTLLELLPFDELQAVLYHEAAHAERRDLLAEALTLPAIACHLPVVGRRLQRALRDSVEAACDERAANRLGSGLPGASALLRLHRWALTTRQALELPRGAVLGLARAGSAENTRQRIQRLLDWSGPAEGPSPFALKVWMPVLLIAAAVLAACGPIHHLLEDLLGTLSG